MTQSRTPEERPDGIGPGLFPAAWGRTAWIAAGIVLTIVLAFMVWDRYLRVAAAIVASAGILTYLLQPIIEWIVKVSRVKSERKQGMRMLAVLLVYAILVAALLGLGSAACKTITRDAAVLGSTWVTAARELDFLPSGDVPNPHLPPRTLAFVEWYKHTIPEDWRTQFATEVRSRLQAAQNWDTVWPWLGRAAQTAGNWISLIVEFIFVPLVAFYFLTESREVRDELLFFISRKHQRTVLRYALGMNDILKRYVFAQAILMTIAWGVVTVALFLLHVKGAIVLGIIAGLSRAIPVIGPVVGAVPILAAVLLSEGTLRLFIPVLIGFILLHLVESKFLMPKILGMQLKMHPVVVILSLLIGFRILGLLGMFLAPPTVAIIRYFVAVRRGLVEPLADDEVEEETPSTPSAASSPA